MADPNNEVKQPVEGDQQPPPPDYQPPVGYNPAANYAPPPATMNPIVAQPTSMAPYPGQGMPPASPYGVPQQPIAMSPYPGQNAMLGALGAAQQIQWMMPPPASPDCPPGLECLTQLDQISLAQQLNLVECKINHCFDVIKHSYCLILASDRVLK